MKNEQEIVLDNDKKNMLVSASAGCGKTHVMIEYIKNLVCEKRISVEKILVLTFTKSAAQQMKDRLVLALQKECKKNQQIDDFIVQQLDLVATSNISTIHSFCEKYIKKYANLLQISSNFQILDENEAKQIHLDAVKMALEKLQTENSDAYHVVMSAYRNNKKKIEKIMMQMKNLLCAVSDGENFLDENYENCEKMYEKAEKMLLKIAKTEILQEISQLEDLHLDDFSEKIKNLTVPLFSSENIQDWLRISALISLPNAPDKRKIGEECSAMARNSLKKIKNSIKSFGDLGDDFDVQKSGNLEKSLILLFKIVEKEENSVKTAKNVLEFSDLEKYMKILSEQENLFENFEYVFVDEYQDTNKIQEKILKNVAKNCNFVAVGDVKQGIYGFRLASSEIFLKDSKDFDVDENSQVCFLKENHRSSKKVLNFVNDVFSKCMTENSCGVDYVGTSMLDGVSEFSDDGEKAVQLKVLQAAERERDVLPEVYSVKNAKISAGQDDQLFFETVRAEIVRALQTQISDKNGKLRRARYADIAILSRNRNEKFCALEDFLRESGIPVLANSKQNLMDSPQLKEILNLMKILLVFDDEIVLLSVLTSPFFNYKIEDVLREKPKEISLCEVVQKNPFFAEFVKKVEKYRVFYQIYGLKKMFFEIFSETDYLSHLRMYHTNLEPQIWKFLDEIERFGSDLPAAISFFENVEISVGSEATPADDSVLLTTIHDSKGMEWPIVFLINCDENLFRSHSADVEIDEEFGLCAKSYDFETGRERKSVKMEAIKQCQKKRDFAEELKIFYVALTRAEARLLLFGSQKNTCPQRLSDCKTYYNFIFYARPDLQKAALEQEDLETLTEKIEFVSSTESENCSIAQDLTKSEKNQKVVEKIENYLNFSYDFGEKMNFRLKESVTNLSNKNQESPLAKFSSDAVEFSDNLIESGNAYHLALKIIDFEKISNIQDLTSALEICREKGVDVALIDAEILLKNILLLKTLTKDAEIFKEKEFIMKINPNQLFDCNFDEKILTQGIVDLFAIKNDQIILVDYKFSRSTSEKYLVEKYASQLKLYKIALEQSFNLPVTESYILSLKQAKLIKLV